MFPSSVPIKNKWQWTFWSVIKSNWFHGIDSSLAQGLCSCNLLPCNTCFSHMLPCPPCSNVAVTRWSRRRRSLDQNQLKIHWSAQSQSQIAVQPPQSNKGNVTWLANSSLQFCNYNMLHLVDLTNSSTYIQIQLVSDLLRQLRWRDNLAVSKHHSYQSWSGECNCVTFMQKCLLLEKNIAILLPSTNHFAICNYSVSCGWPRPKDDVVVSSLVQQMLYRMVTWTKYGNALRVSKCLTV